MTTADYQLDRVGQRRHPDYFHNFTRTETKIQQALTDDSFSTNLSDSRHLTSAQVCYCQCPCAHFVLYDN
jgi:hypothetical protein